MNKNIIITSAGRRGKLVRIFQESISVEVFTTDCRPELAAACVISDGSFSVPRVHEEDYIPRLLEICQKNKIGLIVPTIDTELLVLSENRENFAKHGIQCVVSDPTLIRICRDKRLTHDFFDDRCLPTPNLVNPRCDPKFPLFAKPFDGSCSANIHVIRSKSDLTKSILDDPKLIFLDYLSPEEHDEYTFDMYYDRSGKLKCLVPRLRIETRGGEVSKGRTCWLPEFEEIREKMGRIEGARGCLTVQFFHRIASGELFGIEINPRFGGGFPLSFDAGANYAEWLIREYFYGESINWFDDWERDLTMLRYDDHVLVRHTAS